MKNLNIGPFAKNLPSSMGQILSNELSRWHTWSVGPDSGVRSDSGGGGFLPSGVGLGEEMSLGGEGSSSCSPGGCVGNVP